VYPATNASCTVACVEPLPGIVKAFGSTEIVNGSVMITVLADIGSEKLPVPAPG
jgi:hypothetical protein